MATTVEIPHEQQNAHDQPAKLLDEVKLLNEEGIDKMAEAIKTSKNLDQFLSNITGSNAAKNRPSVDTANLTGSPFKKTGLTESRSSQLFAQLNSPLSLLYDSDEDECTFRPKVNQKSQRLVKRNPADVVELLYKGASEKAVKGKEAIEAEKNILSKRASTTKIDSKSYQIVLQRLQKALSSLISETEDQETEGQLRFEGLGMVLYRIGVFQNLSFIPKKEGGDEEKSSLSINPAKAKPDRMSKEILLHENFWKVLNVESKSEDFVSSDLTMKFLITLVEAKAPVEEAGALLAETLNASLEGTTYAELKESKNLWALEKLVVEFRRLFDDRTSFMNIYANTHLTENKNLTKEESGSRHSFRPQINEKSQKLDNRYFSEKMLKNLTAQHGDINEKDLKNRNNRLYKYHNYVVDKKSQQISDRLEEELAPCTFVPKTTPYKKPVKQGGDTTSTSKDKSGYFAKSQTESQRHFLLHSVAQSYKEKQEMKSYNHKKQEEIDELSQCTFKPKVHTYYPPGEDFYDGVPRGFKKTVDRLYKGEKIKQEKKAERETIPRGENYEKNRQADFKPPSFLQRPKIQRQEVLVSVDVSIGGGKTGKIAIHKDDDPRVLAQQFARTHSLNAKMRDSLQHLLETYINNYFEKLHQKEEEEQARREREEEDDEEEDHNRFNDDEEEEEEHFNVEEIGESHREVKQEEHEQEHEHEHEEQHEQVEVHEQHEEHAHEEEVGQVEHKEEVQEVKEQHQEQEEQHHEEEEHHEEKQEENVVEVEVEEIITERNEEEEHEVQKNEEEEENK